MGATVELQNVGDALLTREITASIEDALNDKPEGWSVSIVGLAQARIGKCELRDRTVLSGRIL
jgi:hypothetical protein